MPGAKNSQTFGTQPIFRAFREPPPNPRFKSRDCAKHAAPGFSEKPLALRFKLPVRKPRYLARLRLFKLSSYLHRLYGHQRANCEKIPQWYGALMDLSRAWRALYPSAEIAGTVSPNGKRPARAAYLRCGTFLASGQICGLRKSCLKLSPHRAPHCPLRFFTRGAVFEPRDCPSRDFPQI